MTIPVVNVYKLGRMPYVSALKVQQVLFDKLKHDVLVNGKNCSQQNNYDKANNFFEHKTKRNSHISTGQHLNNINTYNQPNDIIKMNEIYHKNNTIINTTRSIGDNNQVRNSLLLVEHEPVYTIGIRSLGYNDHYVAELKKKLSDHQMKADFVKTNRGGLITFHGTGQLVAYPIIYLGDFRGTIPNKSVRAYVNMLETVIIDTLKKVGIKGALTVPEYPGVWVGGGDRKIAFIGISCSRFVTMHGISINCNCDLSWFDHIVSCGIEDKKITSIQEEFLSSKPERSKMTQRDKYNRIQLPKESLSPNEVTSEDLAFNTQSAPSVSWEYISEENTILNPNLEFSVNRLSDMFISSFSQHSNCVIIEKDLNSLSNMIKL